MNIADWNDALDDMGAAACPASLWRHWAQSPDLLDPGTVYLFDYLFAITVAKCEATRERTLLQAKCSEYTMPWCGRKYTMPWCGRKGCLGLCGICGGHAI